LRNFTLNLRENYNLHLTNQQYNEMLNAIRDRVIVKRMGDGQAKPLQNECGMENGFNRRIRVLDGIARPVLGISGSEVKGEFFWIPSSVEMFSGTCPRVCWWVAFEAGCKLSRLEQAAFSGSGLTAIHIPASVKVICAFCFSDCASLVSVTFAVDCELSRLDRWAFHESGLTAIHIPASVEVI
jgi:hypothetical protein